LAEPSVLTRAVRARPHRRAAPPHRRVSARQTSRKGVHGARLWSFICFIAAAVTVGHSAWVQISFDDEFDALSLHRTWQQGDKWQLMAPDSADGRGGPNWGEGGSHWWVNLYNPNTPINGIYSVSNGMLNLSLLPTPRRYQSYIDRQAGAHMPYVGALTPGGSSGGAIASVAVGVTPSVGL
jgi:hypothetical protein